MSSNSRQEQELDSLEAKLNQLRAEYSASLADEFERLIKLTIDMDSIQLTELHQGLHRLTGTSGSLGQPELSIQARRLGAKVKLWLDQPNELTSANAALLATEIATLATLVVDVSPSA